MPEIPPLGKKKDLQLRLLGKIFCVAFPYCNTDADAFGRQQVSHAIRTVWLARKCALLDVAVHSHCQHHAMVAEWWQCRDFEYWLINTLVVDHYKCTKDLAQQFSGWRI